MLKSYDVFLDNVESGLLCFPKTQVATKTEPYYLLSFEEKLLLVCFKISNIQAVAFVNSSGCVRALVTGPKISARSRYFNME